MSAKQRQMSPVDNETYHILIFFIKGEFNVPVRESSSVQKAACIRFWRADWGKKFSVRKVDGTEKLFFNDKEVLRKTDLRSLLEKEFKHCKGAGSRKLNVDLSSASKVWVRGEFKTFYPKTVWIRRSTPGSVTRPSFDQFEPRQFRWGFRFLN